MINANELRIGNWILDPAYKLPMCLDVDNMEVLLGARHFNDLDPIPLTPEVLEKCGFKNEEGWQTSWYFNNAVPINIHLGKIYYNDMSRFFEITSLHQLQNLYFALTGNELDYKP